MKTFCQENLIEIKKVLLQLTNEQYTYPSNTLFGATIGQHVRHILEFYQSVLNNLNSKIINYDNRSRNLIIETDNAYAIQVIDQVNTQLAFNLKDESLVLEGNFCADEGNEMKIQTSLFRELAYCLEHSIHHQALIKVGLLEVNCLSFIDESFGLAPATIRHRKICAR